MEGLSLQHRGRYPHCVLWGEQHESESFYTSLVLAVLAYSSRLLFLCAVLNNLAVSPLGQGILHMPPVETI